MHEISYYDSQGAVKLSTVNEFDGWVIGSSEATHLELGLRFSWYEDGENFRIDGSSFQETGSCRFKEIYPCTGRIGVSEGDGRALVLPIDAGVLCKAQNKSAAEYKIPGFFWYEWRPEMINMMLFGCLDNGLVNAMVIDAGRFDAGIRLRTNWGPEHRYIVDPFFELRESPNGPLSRDGVGICYANFSGNVQELAEFYREFNKKKYNFPTIVQKSEISSRYAYGAKAISVRLRLAVKPMPATIPEQTKENEPDPQIFLTFDDCERIADVFHRHAVGPIDFTFVGWNYRGHDGAYPQVFPIEELLGGESAMRRAIANIQRLGFQIGVHDNYTDVYSRGEGFSQNDVLREADGSLKKGAVWAAGQSYTNCPVRTLATYASENLNAMKRFDLNGSYYVDVLSHVSLFRCYHPAHLVSRRGHAEANKKILTMAKEVSGHCSSEGVRDWAFPELDRAYIMANNSELKDMPFADEEIPLFPLVYNDYLIYNCYRKSINALPGNELYLRNLAFGGSPLLYFYHVFMPANEAIGMFKNLTYDSPEQLEELADSVKRISDDYRRLFPLKRVRMTGFIRKNDLSQTAYADGSVLLVNYGKHEIQVGSVRVPPRDFVIIDHLSEGS